MADKPQGRDVDRLRDLLGVSRADAQVTEIKDRLDDRVARVRDVADVLPESVRAANQSGRLAPALDGAVSTTLQDLVRRDPQRIGEVLFPVIGPAVRRAIAEAMKSLVQGLNTAMEQKFSARGLRWRMESWRSGVPFREVVLKHTLEYRVRQVFLIDRKSGLLMAHAGDEDALGIDEDAVSAMLIAIQDFIRDSIGDDDSEALSSAELDDETLWVLTGPTSQLAAVIDGYPPRSLRGHLATRLENMHAAYDTWLTEYPDGGDVPPGLDLILDECLQSEVKEGEQRSGSVVKAVLLLTFLALAALGALGWWWWHHHEEDQRLDEVLARVDAAPGRVLIGVDRDHDPPIIRGLADDLADPPDQLLDGLGFAGNAPTFQWTPYRSTELELVLRRVRHTLQPPDSVGIGATDGRIVISGSAPESWFERAKAYLRAYDEPWPIDSTRLHLDEPPPVGPTVAELAEQVNSRRIEFVQDVELAPGSAEAMQQLVAALNRVRAAAAESEQPLSMTVVGHTDPLGGEEVNAGLREQRARWLAEALIRAGVLNDDYQIESESNRPYRDGDGGRMARVEVRLDE